MKKVVFTSFFVIGLILLGAGNMSAQMAAQTPSVAGEWDFAMNTPGGVRPFKVIFKVDGEKLSGTVKRTSGDVALQGAIKGDVISFTYTVDYNGNALTLGFDGKVTGDAMGGTVAFGGQSEDAWSAKRAPKPANPQNI